MIYKKRCNFRYFLLLAAFAVSFFTAQIIAHAQETPNCYYDSLANSESGGCGGGNQYNCVGPTIKSGMHKGDKPLGKYQFMPKTLRGMGIDPNNFVGNAAAQEAAIRQFTAQNDACLRRNGAYNYIGQVRNGVTITRTGLLGAAHLGGCGGAANWAKNGGGPSDQLGTSLADYAAKFASDDEGNCGEGYADTADRFAQAQAEGQVGCNPALLNALSNKQQALQQQETEAAKALITKPTSVQQLTCFDQYTKLNSDKIGKIHSDPAQGISDTIVPNIEQPNLNNLTQNFLSGILGGGLQSMLSNAISSLGLGNIGGGGGSGNCPMMDQMWDLLQCVDFPKMPSLNDIMGGGGEMSGILSGLGSFGGGSGGIMGQVCSAVKGLMGGGGSGGTSAYQDALDAMNKDYNPRDDVGGSDDRTPVCNYTAIAQTITDMRADLNGNNVIEASELALIDINQDCEVPVTEIDAYMAISR